MRKFIYNQKITSNFDYTVDIAVKTDDGITMVAEGIEYDLQRSKYTESERQMIDLRKGLFCAQ